MDTIQNGIVTLLRSAVTGEALELPEDFDLERAMPLITKHHIAALIYDGAVRCGLPRQDPAMQSLFKSYCALMLSSERQLRELERLFSAFDENGIDYMPLKGIRMKALYPKHELRYMGDADVLIRMEQYDKIRKIMLSLGFQEGAESDHELIWRTNGLYLELHKRLIPSYNKDFYAYFGEGWQIAGIDRGTRYCMSAEDEMIFLFTHFAKHFRDGGIGCRYVADLWVYRNANPNLDESYIVSVLKKLYLADFYKNILRTIDVWFNDAPQDDKTEVITDFVFASGSWGSGDSKAISLTVRGANRSAAKLNGKTIYLIQTLFPDAEALKGKYTILKKAPWMLPLVWLVRPFYKVLFELRSLKKQKQNLEAISDDKMQDRRKLLNFVGLDFNF